ncbi:peroxidase [Rhodocytophaga rosea]|uniref:Peroxidase n=1 Tax=Rhodocytophaga rosea TaxID=2704465 RepID=A0A6C0GQ99_9BACT|nr:peroxidase [Rhodocytophaga rosea]QHT69783.1 peroxidase [Rhodocytophaga rosea]
MEEMVEKDDVQGIIFKGYARLEWASYILLHFTEPAPARKWIADLSTRILSAGTSSRDQSTAIHIAFTCPGLAKLGLSAEELATFPREFTEGMVTEHRQRILGDCNEGEPARWIWGGPNDTIEIHAMLLVYALDNATMVELYFSEKILWEQAGIQSVHVMEAHFLPDGKEHFGFRDGISQPEIKFAGRDESSHEANHINPGEFLFGYKNEYEKYTYSPNISPENDPQNLLPPDKNFPQMKDLGRNGSMMVFRQLHQQVQAFWQFMQAHTDQAPSSIKNPLEYVASKMMGRWPNGAPLTKCPVEPLSEFEDCNDFGYAQKDFDGFSCPVGAHIRRVNPRDNFLRDSTGNPEKDIKKSQVFMKRFRVIRRGRPYGPPLAKSMLPQDILKTEDSGEDRGIFFMCFNSNIGRQFELIHQTWINNPKLAELYEDPDPIVGFPEMMENGAVSSFTMQAYPVRRKIENIPRFVWARGGGYFFMPGIKALQYLGSR